LIELNVNFVPNTSKTLIEGIIKELELNKQIRKVKLELPNSLKQVNHSVTSVNFKVIKAIAITEVDEEDGTDIADEKLIVP
jgi:hypothetical protein